MDIKSVLMDATSNYKIKLSDAQLEQFEKYYLLLVEWNNKINLTAISDAKGVAVKHFADSLSLLNCVEVHPNASIIDIGTGAGFPGIALKIARPDIKLTLLDSLNKRLVFLEEVLSSINLTADLIHARAEDGANSFKYREKFDFAVSRAVARLNVLSEYCIPYVKKNGKFISMKGPNVEEEINESKSAISQLGGKIHKIEKFSLAYNEGERTVIVVNKITNTPKQFPRNSGKIKSSPL